MRRHFVLLGLVLFSTSALGQSGQSTCIIEEASVVDLQAAMADGHCTAHQLVEAYLGRIGGLDASGPTVRSVLVTNPDAFSIADALDAERAAGHVRGPLHGIPVLLKDNIGTADQMPTTAGGMTSGAFAVAHKKRRPTLIREPGVSIP